LLEANAAVDVVHVIELLAESYRNYSVATSRA